VHRILMRLVLGAGLCHPIEGVEKLLAPGRIVLVGEVHGTREMPRLFVDLVCHALKKGFDVVVGFEQPPSAGQGIQRYLSSSKESRVDRFRILEPRVPFGDGTASEAMMDAFESLRLLANETKRMSAFGFVGGPESNGNIGYADGIAAAHQAAPRAVVLALMGSYHNRLTREEDDGGAPVGLLLRQRGLDLKSVYVEFSAGSAYLRGVDGPGIHEPTALQLGGGKPWVVLPAPSGAYDVFISVGKIHPSLPAKIASDPRRDP
jgi:hypothetical protein